MLACAAIGEIALAEIPSVGPAPPPPAAPPPPGHGDYERRRKKSVRPIWDRRPDDPVLTERGSHQPDFDFTSPSPSVEVEDTRPALEPWTPEAILPRPPEAPEQEPAPRQRRSIAHSRTTDDNDTTFASGVAHVAALSSTVDEADSSASYTHAIATAHGRQLDQDERATGNAWTNDDDDDDAVALLLMD